MRIQFILKSTEMHERFGIMILSSVLKKGGHSVNLLLSEKLSKSQCVERVKEYKPHIIGYSLMTGEQNYYTDLNASIRKEYDCFSIFGGPHATFQPELIEKEYVDAICRGEGEIALLELVNRMEHKKAHYDIQNLWFKTPEGQIIKNDIGPMVNNLDELPFADRALMYEADRALRSRGTRIVMTMRGCPYQCTYCFNHIFNKITKDKGDVLRFRSVNSIIEEIKEIKKNYPFIDHIIFVDDTFIIKPNGWLEEFAERYPKEVGIPFLCNVRANLVTQTNAQLLKKAKCKNVFLGIECGDNEIANKLLRRNLTNDQIINAFNILRSSGLKIITVNLLGLPVENPLEADLKTLDLNISLRPNNSWSSLVFPYKGTDLGKYAVERGFLSPTFEKSSVSNKYDSALDFGDKRLKRKIINLHKLFGITIKFPIIRPIIPFLIKLPSTYLYTWIMFATYGIYLLRQSSIKGVIRPLRYYFVFIVTYIIKLERKT